MVNEGLTAARMLPQFAAPRLDTSKGDHQASTSNQVTGRNKDTSSNSKPKKTDKRPRDASDSQRGGKKCAVDRFKEHLVDQNIYIST